MKCSSKYTQKNKVGGIFWMKALCFIEQADGEFHQNRCLFFGTLAKITLIDVCQLSQHKKAHNLETFYISPSIHWIPF